MKFYKHSSYEEYRKAQIRVNRKKLDKVFASSVVLTHIKQLIQSYIASFDDCIFGICHGVRNGWEVSYFRENTNWNVIGTDISPSARRFQNVIEHDFHVSLHEWIGKAGFVYSNALDHSFKPSQCIHEWLKCLSEEGLLFVEWSSVGHNHENVSMSDCWSATKDEYFDLLNRIGSVVMVEDLVDPDFPRKEKERTVFTVSR